MCQSVERTVPDLWTRLGDYWTLVDTAREDLHSAMRHGHESYLRSILAQAAGRARYCGVVYQSDIDMKLGAYESTV